MLRPRCLTNDQRERLMTTTFDSLAFATALMESGFSEQQAKALARAMWQLIDSQLVTKADLIALEERVDRKLEKLKSELIQWMFGVMFGVIVLQSSVTAVLFKMLH
jgi:hypothetical protein